MKKPTEFFDPNELVHAAFRYFLGRRTISACAFADDLAEAAPALEKNTREMIIKEIKEAQKRNELGHQCDIEAWNKCLTTMEGIK
jgi:uncharacterized protein with von Willebrand factor type A (vWA) domain